MGPAEGMCEVKTGSGASGGNCTHKGVPEGSKERSPPTLCDREMDT